MFLNYNAGDAMYFIGADVGTTGTKTIVTDPAGTVCGKGYREYELITGPGGTVEQNAADWWNAVVASVREALRGISDPEKVAALSLSTQGGSTLAVGRSFEPLTPAFTWMDARSAAESRAIADEKGEYVYKTSGWRCDPCFDPPKMRWLAANEPELFRKADQFVSTVEFINHHLTGRNVTDPTNAAMRQLINVATADWDDTLIEIAGLSKNRLPECLPTGAPLGTLTEEAARQLGLPRSVKVYNGAHDQYCASLGSGAVVSGDLLLSTGTTWVILGITEEPLFTASHISPGVHPIKGLYGNMASLNSAGSALKWFRQLTGEDYAALDEIAAQRLYSAETILYYPYYAGSGFPHHIPEVKACCIGMELMHDKYDLARALMEGVAFETRMALEEFAAHGADIRKLKLVGGAAKSRLWSQITCDITNCELQVPAEKDTCCIGAAMLAAVGCGYYPDLTSAARKMVRYTKTLLPDPKAASFYEMKFKRYRAGFEQLRSLF